MKIKFAILSSFIFFSFKILLSGLSLPGGSGDTKDDAYQIWNKTHWIELGDSLDADWNKPWDSWWHSDKHIKLMRDIDTVTKYLTICTIRGYFCGTEKKITLAMDGLVTLSPFLFSGFDAVTTDSFIFDGYIYGYGHCGVISSNTGIAFYYVNNTTIVDKSIYNYGTGGIASLNHGTISHCINNGSVSGVDIVAGIVPHNSNTITNCINTGEITASNSGSGNWSSGGIGGIAYTSSYMSNCINLGNIEGQNNVGGIAAIVYSTGIYINIIENCINAGYIKGDAFVGGIVAKNFYNAFPPGVIKNCINTGVVEGEEDVGSILGKE